MNTKKWFRPSSMPFAILVAVILLVGAYIFPMKSSLGQGVDEHVVTGWQAGYDPSTGKEMLIILHSGEAPSDVPMSGIPKSAFTTLGSDGVKRTGENQLPDLLKAYYENPQAVDEQFGTYDNTSKWFHPFSGEPIAYSQGLLMTFNKLDINPDLFGGPNIPPGVYNYKLIPGGELQIDTEANNNTIIQCKPGMTPFTLSELGKI